MSRRGAHKRGLDLEKLDSLFLAILPICRATRRRGSGTKGGTQNGRVKGTGNRQGERERGRRGTTEGIALHNLKTMAAARAHGAWTGEVSPEVGHAVRLSSLPSVSLLTRSKSAVASRAWGLWMAFYWIKRP